MTSHPIDLALDALRHGRTVARGADHAVPSALSVDEAVLLDQIGYQPLGMVTGASVVGLSAFSNLGGALSGNTELAELTDALGTCRRRAVSRLAEAAASGGAHGVVGVSLDIGDLGGGSHLVHMTATGSAVRVEPAPGAPGCFTAALTGQEVHLLVRAGYQPLGIVSGVCAYHVGRRGFATWAGSVNVNQEMTTYTEALYDARELAMRRLQDQAIELDADGVVGVRVSERTGVWGSHVIEFAAIGTAVVQVGDAHQPLDPKLVMDLS